MTTPKYLIYGLVDPMTSLVRYVGLSSNGLQRPRVHHCPSTLEAEGDTHKTRWIRSLIADGLRFHIAILQESSADALKADEQWWIAYAKASGWPLTNATSGGEQPRFSDESRAKMSAARKRRPRSPCSPETRAKISAARKGWTPSPETRALWSSIRKGYKHTDEARAKISAAGRRRKSQCTNPLQAEMLV